MPTPELEALRKQLHEAIDLAFSDSKSNQHSQPPLFQLSESVAPDGVRLSDLTAGLPLSRDSVFKLIKALGLTTTKGPGPDGRGRLAWLSSAEAARLEAAALAVHRGEVRIADLAQKPQSQLQYHTIPQIRDLIKTSISFLVEEIKEPEFTLPTIAYELSKHVTLLKGDYSIKYNNGSRWNNQVSGAIRQWNTELNGPRLIRPIYSKINRYSFADSAFEKVLLGETNVEIDPRIFGQGMRLSCWIAKSSMAKSTAYKLLDALNIQPLKARMPASRVPVSWLSMEMLNALDPAVKRFHEGSTVASSVKND